MSAKNWLLGTIIGLAIGILVSSAMAYQDWCLNPSGIFRSEDQGTQWAVVWETWISWFLPVSLVAIAVTLPVIYLITRLRR